jgi:hypothetical protein
VSRKFITAGSMGKAVDEAPDIMAQAVAHDRQQSGRGNSLPEQPSEQVSTQADTQANEQVLAQANAHDIDNITKPYSPVIAQINAQEYTQNLKQVPEQVSAYVPEQAREYTSKRVSAHAVKQVSKRARTPLSAQANTRAPKQAPKPLREHASTSVLTELSDDAIADRVRSALTRKVIYPSGRKYSVETPTDIAERIDEYCHDKGRIPARQVFLELMMAFLDEEGY